MNREPMTCSDMLKYVDEVMSGHGTDDMLAVVEKARALAIQMETALKELKVSIPQAPAHGSKWG